MDAIIWLGLIGFIGAVLYGIVMRLITGRIDEARPELKVVEQEIKQKEANYETSKQNFNDTVVDIKRKLRDNK